MRRDATPAERKLWYEFLGTLQAKFTRQKPLGRYIADFYCASHRLVVELDGDSHFSDDAQRYDEERSRFLSGLGIRVLRFTNADVLQDYDAVCRRILEALAKT